MENTVIFLTMKQAAHQVNKFEQTIRRLVKQHAKTIYLAIARQICETSGFLLSYHYEEPGRHQLRVRMG